MTMEWANVDLELGIVTLPETKAGGVQYATLNEEAKEILRDLDSWQRSKWVFPSGNPATHANIANLKRGFRKAVKQSGIPWVRWHDLRHCFASRLAMSKVPLGTIAGLLRHSGTGLVKRYAHLDPDHLRQAVELVASFRKARKPEAESRLRNETVTETVTATRKEEKEEVEHNA